MEPIKTALRARLEASYGPTTLVFTETDKGFSICIHRHPDHVIYIRPDDRETRFLCHYAHREDLERTADDNAEMQEWKQQAVFQLARSYEGGLSKYVDVAERYVAAATERMELYREVSGRGAYQRVRTFAEVVLDHRHNPKPKRPRPTIPPPVCKRHSDVYKEANKRKRIQEAIAVEESARVKLDVWRP
jgi:hypothetical protein